MAFLQRPCPTSGRPWHERLRGVVPSVDNQGFLSGPWGECLLDAVCFEHSNRNWGNDPAYRENGPAGQVIEFLVNSRHTNFHDAADRLEHATHGYLRQHGFLPTAASGTGTPEVWLSRALTADRSLTPGGLVQQGSSQSRSNSSSSRSSARSGRRRLDEQSESLCQSAPLHARIGAFLQEHVKVLPSEIQRWFLDRGASITTTKHLKISFHSTWLVDMASPVVLGTSQRRFNQAIVQILGSEIGDKPLSFRLNAASLSRAMSLATKAGVRVPEVFGIGKTRIAGTHNLDFIVQEFVKTSTVEDEIKAPDSEWRQIATEVNSKLQGLSLLDQATDPLPYFPSVHEQLQWLLFTLPLAHSRIREAIQRFAEQIPAMDLSPSTPVLIHQDINWGNLLTSPSSDGKWALDAVIDWESAVIADPRMTSNKEPWDVANKFARVVKGAHLAECFARNTIPRCDLEELVESYHEAALDLDQRGLLRYESWASLVECCRS